jgi:hypothetical protein
VLLCYIIFTACGPHEIDNPRKHLLYSPVPSGYGKHSAQTLGGNMLTSLEWCVRNESSEAKSIASQELMSALESRLPEEFLNVAVSSGYCTHVCRKMTAAFCIAMYEDVNFGIKQQHILNRYLASHFGTRVGAHKYECSEYTSRFVEFQTEVLPIKVKVKLGGQQVEEIVQVKYCWKDLHELIQRYKDNIITDAHNIEKLAICLGGDHGKGKFTLSLHY